MRRVILAALLACVPVYASAQNPAVNIGAIQASVSSGSIAAENDCVVLGLGGWPGAGMQITGTWTGTITFSASADGGTTYQTLSVFPSNSVTSTTTATAVGLWSASVVGYSHVKACATAPVTGTAVVTLRGTLGGGSTSGGATIEGGVTVENVTVTSSALPDGASTAAKQDTLIASNANIETATVSIEDKITTDTDDASIAAGNTAVKTNALNMVFNGTVWQRLTFGTAGTASSQVLSVQGIASMTPLSSNLFLGGSAAAVGSGVNGSTVQRFTLATDDDAAVDISSIATSTDNAATTLSQILGAMSVDPTAGAAASTTGPQGQLLYSTAPVAVDDGDAVRAAGSDKGEAYGVIRDAAGNGRGANVNASNQLAVAGPVTNAGTFAVQVDGNALTALQLIDDAQTGDSVHYRTSAGSTEDETEIKATAGRLFSVAITNTNAAVRYFRCYNLTAANTTPGTSTVFIGLAIPGATTGAGFTHTFGPNGIAFSTALTCTLTTGAADTNTDEVAANEIKWIISYK